MLKKFLQNEQGSAIVEVAIMFPVILALVVGFIMFTLAVRTDTVLQTAAREAAREYAVTHNAASAREKARKELSLGGIDHKRTVITIDTVGYEKRVSIEMLYPIYVPLAGGYSPTLKGVAGFHEEVETSYW